MCGSPEEHCEVQDYYVALKWGEGSIGLTPNQIISSCSSLHYWQWLSRTSQALPGDSAEIEPGTFCKQSRGPSPRWQQTAEKGSYT